MTPPKPIRRPPIAAAMMRFQAFLLRRNLLGKLGDELLVITTTGRKSGKPFSTPIGYLRAGEAILAVNPFGRSDWFKNLKVNPHATLEIRGKAIAVRAEIVADEADRARVFELYRQQRAGSFRLLFGVPADASPEAQRQALASRQFVRFQPLE